MRCLAKGASRWRATCATELQHDLDRPAPGIDIAAVVIEAIHPPAGAAEAYHAVQAAQVAANASIPPERGRALAMRASAAAQYATDLVTKAQGEAAETVAAASAAIISFAADEAGSRTGPAFLLERYFDDARESLAQRAGDHRRQPHRRPERAGTGSSPACIAQRARPARAWSSPCCTPFA